MSYFEAVLVVAPITVLEPVVDKQGQPSEEKNVLCSGIVPCDFTLVPVLAPVQLTNRFRSNAKRSNANVWALMHTANGVLVPRGDDPRIRRVSRADAFRMLGISQTIALSAFQVKRSLLPVKARAWLDNQWRVPAVVPQNESASPILKQHVQYSMGFIFCGWPESWKAFNVDKTDTMVSRDLNSPHSDHQKVQPSIEHRILVDAPDGKLAALTAPSTKPIVWKRRAQPERQPSRPIPSPPSRARPCPTPDTRMDDSGNGPIEREEVSDSESESDSDSDFVGDDEDDVMTNADEAEKAVRDDGRE